MALVGTADWVAQGIEQLKVEQQVEQEVVEGSRTHHSSTNRPVPQLALDDPDRRTLIVLLLELHKKVSLSPKTVSKKLNGHRTGCLTFVWISGSHTVSIVFCHLERRKK